MARLKETYVKEVIPNMMKEFSYKNVMEVPKVEKVVLTGTEIGLYRHGDTGLQELIGRILSETEVPRVRLSSLQPPEITPGLVALWQDPQRVL